ncbi:hypothetical protein Tco_1049394 [Tanacetum coccineum]
MDICMQSVSSECPGLDDKFIDYVVEENGELISSATLVFDLGVSSCKEGTSAKEDIQKHSSHLVSDLEDKINFKGNGVLWVIWGSQPHMCLAREKQLSTQTHFPAQTPPSFHFPLNTSLPPI